MYPEGYLGSLSYIVLGAVIILVVSPIIHELSHVLLVNIFGISHITHINYTVNGIFGHIDLFSSVTRAQAALILLSGTIITVIIGVVSLAAAKLINHTHLKSLLHVQALGFMFDPAFQTLTKGDVYTTLAMFEMNSTTPLISVVLMILFIYTLFKTVEHIQSTTKERKKTEQPQLGTLSTLI